MNMRHLLLLLAVAGALSSAFAGSALARRHHSGNHHCGPHHHVDWGTNRCVKNS